MSYRNSEGQAGLMQQQTYKSLLSEYLDKPLHEIRAEQRAAADLAKLFQRKAAALSRIINHRQRQQPTGKQP